jgi:membrane-associated phospholipid phosphatase
MAFGLLYSMAFMGYLFVPAKGPVVAMASDFAGPLDGGSFHALVIASIDRLGGPHGAFPSLHLGSSLLLCLYDFRRGDPLRGLIYIPLVAMIALATVALRYHFAVDLVAGGALALFSLGAAARISGRRLTA